MPRPEFVETRAQRQEVAPSFAFALRRAQQEGRVKHRQCRDRLVEPGDREAAMGLDFAGVYRLTPDIGTMTLLVDDFGDRVRPDR
jgi:hypothetical protein